MKYRDTKDDYAQLKSKLRRRLLLIALIAFLIILVLYTIVWRGRGGDWVVSVLQLLFGMDHEDALNVYGQVFRNYIDIVWIVAIAILFFILLRVVLNWVTRYFDTINQGIDDLLNDDSVIRLPSEMIAIERKLNTVKQELKQRTLEAQLAEKRKNDLVVYLAHDIRTPLTSVIGYLNLLEEAPEMSVAQKAKYIGIALDKAYYLEKMINEFFEITRYNLQEISLSKGTTDLHFMLIQLTDELSSTLFEKGNSVAIKVDENLTVFGDPDRLARVFNNVMKNAAAYSYPNTEIQISAEEKDDSVVISFKNRGKTIPEEKLASLFDKFYRLDEARTSNTAGAGLGLAIAREIVTRHGGTITASSENETVLFTITLPMAPQENTNRQLGIS